MFVKFGIRQKLALIFFLFFLIFTGTISMLILDVRKMMATTSDIVTRNNRIDLLCSQLNTQLSDMDTNSRKLRILNNHQYGVYFSESVRKFEKTLQQLIDLLPEKGEGARLWHDLDFSYKRHRQGTWDDISDREYGRHWVTEQIVNRWHSTIVQGRIQNQKRTEMALVAQETRAREISRKSLIGATITAFAALLGLLYISRSVIAPLNHLAEGLRRLPAHRDYQPIPPHGGIEFQELIGTFNDMSRQLCEEDVIRNEFIASLSHEIRTPLSSIRESVNMVVEEVFGPVSDRQRKFLTIAVDEISRINRLLDHLLRVSILDAEEKKGASTTCSAAKLVDEIIEQLSPLSAKKNLTVTRSSFPKDGGLLYGLVDDFRQVFQNVIGNAIKYSPIGESVQITCSPAKKSGFLRFEVIDHGAGIDEDELSLIFTRYYRTRAVRGHMDGVGLGLPIARKIVTGYGGSIAACNNRGSGTTFSFTLPAGKRRGKEQKSS